MEDVFFLTYKVVTFVGLQVTNKMPSYILKFLHLKEQRLS